MDWRYFNGYAARCRRSTIGEFEFDLLGPLQVRRGDVVMPVPRGKERALLAALLLSANRVVSADALAEILWPQGPPPSARVSLQNYVKRLRRALGDSGHARLVTSEPGYLIRVDRDELDITRFEYLIAAARRSARSELWRAAADQLRAALGLWRGEPLLDVQADPLLLHSARLQELRLQALAECLEAELHCGRHAEALTELPALIEAYPLRENFHALLVIALERSGRRDEALAACRQARRLLREELGIEPGAALRELQRRVLAGEPTLAVHGRDQPPESGAIPRQLPAPPRYFVGRERESRALDRLRELPEGVPIAAVCGTAGVGKTAMAVHWAHQAATYFPDGQLYVDLRGFSPSLAPVTPAEALHWLLLALQIPGSQIPADLEARTALYRSVLSGRRALIVVDNAAAEQDVRPLLPGSAGCMVIVTSRSQLLGLVSAEGALAINLEPLDPAAARRLVAARVGTRRMEREAQSCNDLIGLCARLPLALNIATARCAIEPIWSVAAQMRDAGKRLAALETGDPATSVRAVFSCSYDRLSDPAARMFRLLGLHFGPDATIGVAASLAAISVPDASLLMDELANAHLATEHSPGRYVLHDLLHAYAAELATTQDDEADRAAACNRALDHYLHGAAVAMDILYPAERHRRPSVTPSPASMVPPMADEAAARAWLEPERANLVAAVSQAADHGWPDHATRLAGTLLRHLRVTGHYPDITTVCNAALRAARLSGDRQSEADALQGLAIVAMRHSRYQEAAALLRKALSRYRDARDRTGEARTLGNLGIISGQLGHYRQAIDYNQRALARYRQVGDQPGEVRTLNNLSLVDLRLGHVQRAADQLQQALELAQALQFDEMKVFCLTNLGVTEMRLGQLDQAADRIRQAVALSRQLADPVSETVSLASLAAVRLRQGRHRQAMTFLRRALDLARQLGDESAVAEVLNGRGELLLATGRASQARDTYAEALILAAKACDRYQEALAHDGLAQAHDAAGEAAESGLHRQAATALFARLGTPEAQVAAGASR